MYWDLRSELVGRVFAFRRSQRTDAVHPGLRLADLCGEPGRMEEARREAASEKTLPEETKAVEDPSCKRTWLTSQAHAIEADTCVGDEVRRDFPDPGFTPGQTE